MATGAAGRYHYQLPWRKARHAIAHSLDDSRNLMPKYHRFAQTDRAESTTMIIVQIGTADPPPVASRSST